MIQSKILLFSLLTLSVGSIYPYYLSMHNRSVLGAFSGLVLWLGVKSLQLFPLIVSDGNTQYIVMIFALAIDAAILQATYSIASGLSHWIWLGAGLISPLLALRVARREFGVMLPVVEVIPNPPRHAAPVFQAIDRVVPVGVRSVQSPSDREFVSQLIPKVASLFIAGLSGSGKDFVGSVLCEYLQSEFDAKIMFVDPKNDPNEHLWDNANYQYRFSGTMMEPDDFLNNLKKAFKQYSEKLSENGSGQYTILVLNELATCATKCDNSSDKKWLSATLQPMLSGLDSAGGAVIVLTQTLIMPTGFNSGTVSQFQKLIICRDENLENLSTQSKTVLMAGVDLLGARDACEDSPVDRAIYSSALRKWLALPKMRQGQSYYDRDARQWIGSPPENKKSENRGNLGNSHSFLQSVGNCENSRNSVIPTVSTSVERDWELEGAILELLRSVAGSRTIDQIATTTSIRRSGGNAAKVRSSLNLLEADGYVVSVGGGWLIADLN
jgi:hypothetical protein